MLGIGYINARYLDPASTSSKKYPKTFDWLIPLIYVMLLPMAIYHTNEFFQLWSEVVWASTLTFFAFFSILIGKPLIRDWASDEMYEDERCVPILDYVWFWNTIYMGILFSIVLIMEIIVAVDVNLTATQYDILNDVLPNLVYFMVTPISLTISSKRLFMNKATQLYGSEYMRILDLEKYEKEKVGVKRIANQSNIPSEPLLKEVV
jgi:hypothetical protein